MAGQKITCFCLNIFKLQNKDWEDQNTYNLVTFLCVSFWVQQRKGLYVATSYSSCSSSTLECCRMMEPLKKLPQTEEDMLMQGYQRVKKSSKDSGERDTIRRKLILQVTRLLSYWLGLQGTRCWKERGHHQQHQN